MSDPRGSEERPPPMTPAERRAAAIRKATPAPPSRGAWPPADPTPTAPAAPAAPEVGTEDVLEGPDVHTGSHVHPHDRGSESLGDGPDQAPVAGIEPDGVVVGPQSPDGEEAGARSVSGDGHETAEEIAAEVDAAEQIILDDLDRLQSERDGYLDQLLRTRADFDNYRKRMLKQQSESSERAAEALAEKLLEVLDTFDAAVQHGSGFEQGHAQLVAVLEKQGLERIDPAGQEFDPTEADAVAHEDGDEGPVVAAVLRPGYRWKGRVLRPAMVKVRG